MIIDKPFCPQRITVWCGFWEGWIIGPYFCENEAGAAVLVNGLRYRTMINEILWPELEDMDMDDVYCQQPTLRTTQVAKPSIFCAKSFQTK